MIRSRLRWLSPYPVLDRFWPKLRVLVSLRASITSAILVTTFSLVLYLSMLPAHLTGADFAGDSGDFLTAMLVHGVPHPSGYPTYTLLGILVQYLPFGTPVTRGALLSAIPAALAVGLFGYWLVRWVVGDTRHSWVSGLVAGFAAAAAAGFWSQAVIVEVYSLQALFVVLTIIWATLLSSNHAERSGNVVMALLALAFGLGMGNHLTLLLMAPIILVAAWLGIRRGIPPRWLTAQTIAVGTGLLTYLYLPLAASSYPAINWGNPQTWDGFRWLVSGQPYQGMLFGLEWTMIPERLAAWAKLIWSQFGLVGLLVGVVGLVQFRFQRRFFLLVMLWVFVVFSVFAIGYRTDDSLAYLIPAYLVFAGWIGLGVFRLLSVQWRSYPLGFGLIAVVLVALLVRIPGTYRQVDPRSNTAPSDFAEQYLAKAPPDAILLTNSDADSFPLWYVHFGLQQRPDVKVVVLPLTQFAWYQETLMHTYPELHFPAIDPGAIGTTRWGDQIPRLNPANPVCRSTPGSTPDSPIQTACQG